MCEERVVSTDLDAAGTGARQGPHLDVTGDDRRRFRGAWVAVAATLLAALLGLRELDQPALSYDEAYTVGVVHAPFSVTWARVTSWDTVQAPYYLLMSLWYEVGERELLLRLPSVGFFVASVPLVFVVGRRLVDERVGAAAAVLLALNSLALDWAQQARSYAMALFLVTVSTYLLVRAIDRPHATAPAVTYGLVAALAVYAHFVVGLVVVAQLASLLILDPRPRRLLVRAGATLAIIVGPAAVWVLTLRSDPLSWLQRPSPRDALAIVADVAGGGVVQLLVIGAAVGAGIVAAAHWQRRSPGSIGAWGRAMPVLWLVMPIAVLAVSTYTFKPLLHPRYLVVVLPALTLVAALGVVWLLDRDRRLGATAAIAVLLASVAGAATHLGRDDQHHWRSATAMVLAEAEPGDAVVVVPDQARPAVAYYQRRLPGPEVPMLTPRREDPPAGPRLWVVEQTLDGPLDTSSWDPMPGFDEWRADAYRLVDERPVSDVLAVRLYERRP